MRIGTYSNDVLPARVTVSPGRLSSLGRGNAFQRILVVSVVPALLLWTGTALVGVVSSPTLSIDHFSAQLPVIQDTHLEAGAFNSSGVPPLEPRVTKAVTLRPDASCDDCVYYMQEGTTIEQACFTGVSGSCTGYAGFSSLYVDVQVKSSPYPTGFELNGYTNTGDWFQSTVVENWCTSGFVVANEVFNNAGTSVYGPCVSSDLSINAGNEIELGLYVSTSGSTSGDVCFTTSDLTVAQPSYLNCVSQPDGGSNPASNYFTFGGGNGFFTGPMTEIYDASATSCQSYLSMPIVQYQFVPGAYIINFTPWSDEWYPSTDSVCYSTTSDSAEWTMSPGDSAAQFVDASAASSYGPHWESARNTSSLSSTGWWTFTTDAVLPTPLATPASMDLGQSTQVQFYEPVEVEHIDSNPTFAEWNTTTSVIDPCSATDSSEILTCTVSGVPGSDQIRFTMGEVGGYSLVSPTLNYAVYADPQINSITLAQSTLDVGEQMTAIAVVTGGSGGFTYAWSGLPSGCVAANSSTIRCRPAEIGWTNISVIATDSNGLSAFSSQAVLHVESDPTVFPYNITPASGSLDIRQMMAVSALVVGGSGIYSYKWNGLPSNCVAPGAASVSCEALTAGTIVLNLSVTDSNGFTVNSSEVVFHVFPDPLAKLAIDPTNLLQGDQLSLDAIVSGGVAPYFYTWGGLPPGCSSEGPGLGLAVLYCIPSSSGTYAVTLNVSDSAGFKVSSSAEVTVVPSFLGLPVLEGFVLFILVPIAALIVILVVVLARRRKGRSRGGKPRGENLTTGLSDSSSWDPNSYGTSYRTSSGVGSSANAVPAVAVQPVYFEKGPTGAEGLDPGLVSTGTPLINPPNPVCWHCGFENPAGSRYCTRCALPLEPPSAPGSSSST